jgi:hypothetical protein
MKKEIKLFYPLPTLICGTTLLLIILTALAVNL